jgi:inner membrane protein
MPTILSHAAVPLALGLGLGPQRIPTRLLVVGVVASMLPDLDVLAFRFHIAYADALGHRGASHSLVFAFGLALVVLAMARHLKASSTTAFWFTAVCAASHGVLDTFTNGGLGAALWWPFSEARVFAPWQVIEVSPLRLRRVFSAKGWAVLLSELLWIWLPALLIGVTLCLARLRRTAGPRSDL